MIKNIYYLSIFPDYINLDKFSVSEHDWPEDGTTNIIHQPDFIIFNIFSSKSDSVDEVKSLHLRVVWEFSLTGFSLIHNSHWK